MALTKLTILVERAGSNLQFGEDRKIVAAFNPGNLKFSRSASWKSQGAALRDVPELQFTGAQPRTLSVGLLFDTFDTDEPAGSKQKVTELTDEMLKLTTVESHGDKHRPPVCQLRWGAAGVFFQGVLEHLEQDFILFMENGTPVRARLTCSFKEWRTNYDDLNRQRTESSDVAKVWTVRRGESLASIAAEEYLDPRRWRSIAEANDIDDPLRLAPGRALLLPAVGPIGRAGRHEGPAMSHRDALYDTLNPAFNVRVNGAELPQEAVADVIAVEVHDDVEAASMCTLKMKGWDGVAMKVKWMDDDLFAEGNPVEIDMGYRDQTKKLFAGEIVGLEPDFPEGQPPTFMVRCFDLRHRLMRERRTLSFLDATDSDVVTQVAQAAGLGVRAENSGVKMPYLLQHNQTDYQFLAARAARIGWELLVDGRELVFRPRASGDAPALSLRREVELLQFRPRLTTMGQAPSREVRGWSARDKQALVAHAAVGDEGPLMGGSASGGATAQRAFSRGASAVVERPVHGQEDADQLVRQGFREMGLAYIRAEGTCIGEPRLKAGIVAEIVGLGQRFSGNYYLTAVVHRFGPATGYRTNFSARRNAT